MSLALVKINWDAKPYLNEVRKAMEEVAEDGASYAAEEAKRNLERMAPDSTGTLASQIDVKASQFEGGGWLVEAQGHGNYQRYYASFVELGTSKMVGLGYLRKALRRARYRMAAKMRQFFGEVRG